MRLCIAMMLSLCLSVALAQYLYDDWSDGNADGWIEMDSLVTYEVTDSLTYWFHYEGGEEANGLSYWGMEMPGADYQILTHFVAHGPTDYVGAEARFEPTGKTGYVAYANYDDDAFEIGKYNPSYTMIVSMGYSLQADIAYSMKLLVSGTTLMAKIWVMGETEPDWMLSTTDSEFTDPLYVLLEAFRVPQGTFSAEFYSILVEEVPSALEQSTWGAIKNSF